MNDKCYLCSKRVCKTTKEEYLKGLCSKCIEKIEETTNEKMKEKNEFSVNSSKISNIIKKLKNLYSQDSRELLKSSDIKFKGEVRTLNEDEKKNSTQCPYCKLAINTELYFYPLVIHHCESSENAYYHRDCFAKFMSEGNYQCLSCGKNLFEYLQILFFFFLISQILDRIVLVTLFSA